MYTHLPTCTIADGGSTFSHGLQNVTSFSLLMNWYLTGTYERQMNYTTVVQSIIIVV